MMIEANEIYLFMVDKELKMFIESFCALTQLFRFLYYSQSIFRKIVEAVGRSPKYIFHLILCLTVFFS